jgi:hypothetical protein
MTISLSEEIAMPETIEEWAALASFILAVASAFAEEHRIMMMACVWCIGYTFLAMRRSND